MVEKRTGRAAGDEEGLNSRCDGFRDGDGGRQLGREAQSNVQSVGDSSNQAESAADEAVALEADNVHLDRSVAGTFDEFGIGWKFVQSSGRCGLNSVNSTLA